MGENAPTATPVVGGFNPAMAKNRRIELGWDRDRVAAATGAAVTSIMAWEAGHRSPGPGNLKLLTDAYGLPRGALIHPPRDQWTLIELRETSGLEQAEAATHLGMTPRRLRHIENGGNELPADVAKDLAGIYHSSVEEIRACWQRGRDRLNPTTTTTEGQPE
jgi:transcriptional regulator with XRE-family HTH domain